MMIDASAIIAILNAEADAPRLAGVIDAAKAPFTSPIAVYEATVALMQRERNGPRRRPAASCVSFSTRRRSRS